MKFLLLLITTCCISCSAFTQTEYNDEILKVLNGKQIEWVKHYEWVAKVQDKSTKNWGLYSIRVNVENSTPSQDSTSIQFDTLLPPIFSQVHWDWIVDNQLFTVVEQGKKKGILVNPYKQHASWLNTRCIYEEIEVLPYTNEAGRKNYHVLAKLDGKWGSIDWSDGLTIIDFIHAKSKDVPLLDVGNIETQLFKRAKAKYPIDQVTFTTGTGDGFFKARHAETGKWGMYQGFDITEWIPMEFDSLNYFMSFNSFTAVFNDGKVGFYLSYEQFGDRAHLSIPCVYDDFEIYDGSVNAQLAVQKNGKWAWLDWLTGEFKSEFAYDSFYDLPEPEYEQKYSYDD